MVLQHGCAEAQAQVGRGHRRDLAGVLVDQLHLGERLDDLLSVRADVLHGRGADGAGDAGHRLDPGQPLRHRVLDERVPVVARLHPQPHEAGPGGRHPLDALRQHADDRSVERLVADEEVGAATQHEQGLVVRPRPAQGGDELVGRGASIMRSGAPPVRSVVSRASGIGSTSGIG